ncbi:hypothetical protein [Pseudonocardia sp.]|uniref:hypothetical protein n=1 Tax=Pseudonocardia sp. TaxID=60912 RepID=UPI00262CEF24|nr:hypothetical protein [Pseudonocardia sp.]
MAPDSPDWTVPAPVRALAWWPGVAFVLVLIAPDVAAASIASAGLVLVVLGALLEAVGGRVSPAVADPRERERDPERVA